MGGPPHHRTASSRLREVIAAGFAGREIIIPHDPAAAPLKAVRSVLIQSSLAELKTLGHYERYAQFIDPDVLAQLSQQSLAPEWISIELAHAHYEACDRLQLTKEQLAIVGSRVGARVQSAVLISLAKKVREPQFDLWSVIGPLHRMWARVFDGGSVQISRLGPSDELVEETGYSLFRHHYYREAHLAVLKASHAAVGVDATVVVHSYNPRSGDLSVRITWT